MHSASLVEGGNGDLLAVWFGGSREGAGDVRIYLSRLEAGSKHWSKETAILSRQEAGAELNRYIKKLGNPVLGRGKDGQLWLFYVTVSAGGWSGSSINYQVSADNGKNWSSSRRLVTSPFFNVSTLVRGAPLVRADGTLSIPVYHELLGKFSEVLRIDKNGEVLSKRRVSHGRQSFQPAVAALTERQAVMLARSASKSDRHIFISFTKDAGKTWSAPAPTTLPNPDAGIALATGTDNSLLVVYNDSQTDRSNLALAVSHDLGKTWKRIYYFEQEKDQHHGEEYSYPTLVRSGNEYHLVYTWKRQGIRYVSFNTAWVRQQELRQ
ncbi:MAG: sialidase family protein [Acidiferrobacterales bacterium]